eukprot:63585-Rhodomonas_salina.1
MKLPEDSRCSLPLAVVTRFPVSTLRAGTATVVWSFVTPGDCQWSATKRSSRGHRLCHGPPHGPPPPGASGTLSLEQFPAYPGTRECIAAYPRGNSYPGYRYPGTPGTEHGSGSGRSGCGHVRVISEGPPAG